MVLVTFVFLSCIRNTWQAQGQHTSEFSISTQARQLALKKKNVALRKSKRKLMSTNLEISQLKERARKHAIEKANWRSEDTTKPTWRTFLTKENHMASKVILNFDIAFTLLKFTLKEWCLHSILNNFMTDGESHFKKKKD